MELKKLIDFDKKKRDCIEQLLYKDKLHKYELDGYRAIDMEEYNEYKSKVKVGRPISTNYIDVCLLDEKKPSRIKIKENKNKEK